VSVASVVQRRPRNSAGDSCPLRAAAADKRNQSAGGRTAGVVRELCFVVRLFSAAGRAGDAGLYSGAAAGRVASRRVARRYGFADNFVGGLSWISCPFRRARQPTTRNPPTDRFVRLRPAVAAPASGSTG